MKDHSFEKKYQRIIQGCFYCGILLLALYANGLRLLWMYTIGAGSSNIQKIGLALVFCKVLFTKYTKKEFFFFFFLNVLAIYNYRLGGSINVLYNILIMAALKDIDLKKMFKLLFWGCTALFVIVILTSAAGIGAEFYTTSNWGDESICPRTFLTMGYFHPNILHQTFALIIIYGVLGYYEKIKLYHLLLAWFPNYLLYMGTDCKTGYFGLIIFSILILGYKHIPKILHSIPIKSFIWFATLSAYIGYVLCVYEYYINGSQFVQLIDQKLTTGRIYQAVEFFSQNAFSLWGQPIIHEGFLDCAFLLKVYSSGLLFGGILFLGLFFVLYYALRKDRDAIVIGSLFFVLYSFYEAEMIYCAPKNILIFFIGELIYQMLRHERYLKNRVYDSL